ncbi:MAG: TIGR00300 family protein [Candidatus Methanomethylicota archaeon]|uniref:Ornithine cyclodeaminase n=1 Tax=Thermoproteota archaeon TaxID=2056631 RepID=A0A497ELN1_9CREN|nr:MAG: TIGR00300 family protein [Candidatus Verstraetearchaeota archaeon]
MILPKIWDRIMEMGGDFEVLEFRVGRRKTDTSYIRMVVRGRSPQHLEEILREIYLLGAVPLEVREVTVKPAPADMVLPDDFYSTTNNPTYIYFKGRWIEVEDIMMDKVIVVDPVEGRAYCKAIREVKKGDLIVVGEEGIKVKPPERPRESIGIFRFMVSEASSEKPSTTIIRRIAQDLYNVKKNKGKVVVVAGPAVVHTGAAEALASLIREGFVDVLLSGNALAVHDVEAALLGTSLGISLKNGVPSARGHRNHMVAINEIFKAGGLRAAVEKGILRKGIMYECIRRGVPFVLAGSIRDDGPLPEVITDVVEAQRRYREALKGASMVLMLATALHSIAVGNMLPSTVKLVCVDINPSTVTKLLDRGSTQAVGVISDIGTFLPLLAQELQKIKDENGVCWET